MADHLPIVTPHTVLAAMRDGTDVRPAPSTLREHLQHHRVRATAWPAVEDAVAEWLQTFNVHLGSAATSLDTVTYLSHMAETGC